MHALQAEWNDHPPVHHLVASYLGYTPESLDDDESDEQEPDVPFDPARTAWMQGMGAIPAAAEFREATTSEAALAAAERMFFGDIMEL